MEPRVLDDREPQRDRNDHEEGEGAYLERIVPAGELSHEENEAGEEDYERQAVEVKEEEGSVVFRSHSQYHGAEGNERAGRNHHQARPHTQGPPVTQGHEYDRTGQHEEGVA